MVHLPLFVSPFSYTVLLFQCFLLNIYCGINRWAYFQQKSTFCNNFAQKGGWPYIQGRIYFWEITVIVFQTRKMATIFDNFVCVFNQNLMFA